MLILTQIKKLRELHQKYAYDLATLRQKGIEFDDEERLKTLAMVEFHSKVLEAIHDYVEITSEEPISIGAAAILLESFAGTLAGILYHKDPEMALLTLVKGSEMKEKNYHKEGGQ